MFSKISRIGAEPVKWQFSVQIVKLSLPSLKSACVVLSRGESKVQTDYASPKGGYFSWPEPLVLTCTLYKKKDKGGHAVYLPKEGEVRVLERGKVKEMGVVPIDFARYVDEDERDVDGVVEEWRIEKSVDKYNNFISAKVSARKVGGGGGGGGGVRGSVAGSTGGLDHGREEMKEDEDGEVDEEAEDAAWRQRNAKPAPATAKKPTAAAKPAAKNRWKDEPEEEEEEEEEAEDEEAEDDEIVDEDEEESPKKPAAASRVPARTNKAREEAEEAEFARKLAGAKGARPGTASTAKDVGRPTAARVEEKKASASKPVKRDKSKMTAKEQLLAPSSDEEEEEKHHDSPSPAPSDDDAPPIKPAKGKPTAVPSKPASVPSKPARSLNWEVFIPTSASNSPKAAGSPLSPGAPITAKQLFGCTLDEALTVYPSAVKSPPSIPHALTFLLSALEKANGLLTPSLFKQYVDPSTTASLRTQLESGSWKLKAHADDPHALGAVLKAWVASLHDGLISDALTGECLRIGRMDEDDDIKGALVKLLSRLPALHRVSLSALVHFLQAMTQPLNTRRNGMNAKSLSTAWGATLVRVKPDPKKSAYDQFQEKTDAATFVAHLITHVDAFKDAKDAKSPMESAAKKAKPAPAAMEEEEDGKEEEVGVAEEGDEDGEANGEEPGLKFHEEEEDEEMPKGKGKGRMGSGVAALDRLERERERIEKEKVDKEKVEKDRKDAERAAKEAKEREEKAEKAKREREERERKDKADKEKREREERERKEKEEKEKREREKLIPVKKPPPPPFKPVNVFGDSDLEDEDADDAHPPPAGEAHTEDEEVQDDDDEDAKPAPQPPPSKPAKPGQPSPASGDAAKDKEVARLQAEVDALKKAASTRPPSSSSKGDDVADMKKQLVAALKEKDAVMKASRESSNKLSALESERVSQSATISKMQKLLLSKGKIDAAQLAILQSATPTPAPTAPSPPPDEGLAVLQLKLDASVAELNERLEQEAVIRKQLKHQLEALTEENATLRQRSLHFDALVSEGAPLSQGKPKGKEQLLAIIDAQSKRIGFLEASMKQNEDMTRMAKAAWADTARIMESEMEGKDSEIQRLKEAHERAVSGLGVEFLEMEEVRKKLIKITREKERAEKEKKEAEDEARRLREQLDDASKTVTQLEDDTRLLKEELTRTGIALKTIADDNFELKEMLRLSSKGKKG